MRCFDGGSAMPILPTTLAAAVLFVGCAGAKTGSA